jgi:hypothetical protein
VFQPISVTGSDHIAMGGAGQQLFQRIHLLGLTPKANTSPTYRP